MALDKETKELIEREVSKLCYSDEINGAIEKRVREDVETWIDGRTEQKTRQVIEEEKELRVRIEEMREKKVVLEDKLIVLNRNVRVKEARMKYVDLYKLTPGDISSAISTALIENRDLKALIPALKEKTATLKQINMLTKKTEGR